MTQGEAEIGTSKVVAGQIFIAHTSSYALIDFGTLYLLVSATFVKRLDDMCIVSLTLGENLTSSFGFKVVTIKIARRKLPVDWMVLEMVDYDVTLGMDWLSKHNATIFCRKKNVVFQPSKGEIFEYKGTP